VEVRGNGKTAAAIIERQLTVHAGDSVSAGDPRVDVSRFRVLALGFFSDVQIRLEKGRLRGRVVLVVEVVERGTLILNQLFFGTSEAIPLWGGMDVSENNWGGRGIGLGGAFLLSTGSAVPLAKPQRAYRLRLSTARIRGSPVSFSATLLYNDASEPYRTSGLDSSSDPRDFTAVRYSRAGGVAGVGIEVGESFRLALDYRLERVDAAVPTALVRTLPNGETERVDVGLRDGVSLVSSATLSFERDTRNDPVLPTDGTRLGVAGEVSSRAIGSSYEFYKLSVQYQGWFRLRWGHVVSIAATAGLIIGDAPIFDRFYIGDLNPLLPPRALGLTLSTLPSRNILSDGIAHERWGTLGARAGVEYLWPVFRGGRYFYGGHVFGGAGALALTSLSELQVRTGPFEARQLPIDLYFDAGLRLDTYVGIFTFSIANFLGRLPL
jgi:outer membrane protein assembly factor BamA